MIITNSVSTLVPVGLFLATYPYSKAGGSKLYRVVTPTLLQFACSLMASGACLDVGAAILGSWAWEV